PHPQSHHDLQSHPLSCEPTESSLGWSEYSGFEFSEEDTGEIVDLGSAEAGPSDEGISVMICPEDIRRMKENDRKAAFSRKCVLLSLSNPGTETLDPGALEYPPQPLHESGSGWSLVDSPQNKKAPRGAHHAFYSASPQDVSSRETLEESSKKNSLSPMFEHSPDPREKRSSTGTPGLNPLSKESSSGCEPSFSPDSDSTDHSKESERGRRWFAYLRKTKKNKIHPGQHMDQIPEGEQKVLKPQTSEEHSEDIPSFKHFSLR
ncbi:MAG: hypothetical protein ACO3A2_09410, partial [Bdellovibrionia bacterium]